MLTDAAIRKIIPQEKPFKVSDTPNLHLYVSPSGGKLWRMPYRFHGKAKQLSFGKYPHVGLADARSKRDDAMKILSAGVDPSSHKQLLKDDRIANSENSFEKLAREFLVKMKLRVGDAHLKKTTENLQNNVFPWIGKKPISEINEIDVIKLVERVEGRGAYDTAARVKQLVGQVCRYAITRGYSKSDPTASLRGLGTRVRVKHFAAPTEPSVVQALLRSFDGFSGSLVVRNALLISPYIFVRPGELRHMEWTELDFDANRWTIPAVKAKKAKDLIVPLSTQVVALLKELQPLSGKFRYVFYGERDRWRPMSSAAVNAALKRLGWNTATEITGHGFRAMARTLLDEKLGYSTAITELQISHRVRGPLGDTYNRTAFIAERTLMMQVWADYLDNLKGEI